MPGAERRPWPRRVWKEYLEPVVFAVVFTQFLGTMVGVSGASMMPNFRDGERVLIPKYETWLHKAGIGNFQRGDVLVFKPPAEAGSRPVLGLWSYRPFLIKRLIALPGDTVRVAGGEVFVNGERTAQNFTTDYWREQGCWDTESDLANNAQSDRAGIVPAAREFVVPEGKYFVMGDNRTVSGSEDSRSFGPVPLRDIAGRAAVVVWPVTRKVDARYDCGSVGHGSAGRVQYSGKSELNLRFLPRPAALQQVRDVAP